MPRRIMGSLFVLSLFALPAASCSVLPHPAPSPSTVADTPVETNYVLLRNDTEHYRLYDAVRNATAGIPYVTAMGYDEGQNKVVIDVGTLEAKQAVEQAVSGLDLPEGFVEIRHPQRLLSEAAPCEGCLSTAPPNGGEGGLLIPAVMNPGEAFALSILVSAPAGQIPRGVDSYLECWDGRHWSPRYIFLVGPGDPDNRASAQIMGNQVLLAIGLPGPGPERLALPTTIPKGWYRLRKEVIVKSKQQTLTALFEVR
ncbi:MAG: hypothetical protein ACM3XM_18645 [Mycobacterium leprae]